MIYENGMHLASSSFVKGSSISISSLSSFKNSVSDTGSCKKGVSPKLGFGGSTPSLGIMFVYFLFIH